jgi:hypothetical protein
VPDPVTVKGPPEAVRVSRHDWLRLSPLAGQALLFDEGGRLLTA